MYCECQASLRPPPRRRRQGRSMSFNPEANIFARIHHKEWQSLFGDSLIRFRKSDWTGDEDDDSARTAR